MQKALRRVVMKNTGVLRPLASEIFVDRLGPRDIFSTATSSLLAAPKPTFKLITFYGAGGQGKTSLCGELRKMASSRTLRDAGLRSAFVDLSRNPPGDRLHALVSIRNAIAKATGARFACFDLALTDYCDMLGLMRPRMVVGAPMMQGFMSDTVDGTADTFAGGSKDAVKVGVKEGLDSMFKEGVGDVFSDIVGAVPVLGPSAKRMSKWAFATGAAAYLKTRTQVLETLYGGRSPGPDLILASLADVLAHEFGLFLKARNAIRLALFIDEYENAIPAGGSMGSTRLATPWDETLREVISCCATGRYPGGKGRDGYDYDAGFLLLIFGREKLRWEALDPAWTEDMQDQHLLGGLETTDSDDFLIQAGVHDPALREAIILSARAPDPNSGVVAAFPVMLDLGVQIYFQLKDQGRAPSVADFDVKGESYAVKRRKLFERFMRGYSAHIGLETLLRRLACARRFDRELANFISDRFARAFDMAHFDDLTSLSCVQPAGQGGWIITSHIRDTLLESLPSIDREATHRELAAWYVARGVPASTKAMTMDHARAFGEALIHMAEAEMPLDDFRTGPARKLFQWPAASALIAEAAEIALAIRVARGAITPKSLGVAYEMTAFGFFHSGDGVGMGDRVRKAIEAYQSEQQPDALALWDAWRNLAAAAFLVQDWDEADRCSLEAARIRREAGLSDDMAESQVLESMATIAWVRGDQSEARALMDKAVLLARRATHIAPLLAADVMMNHCRGELIVGAGPSAMSLAEDAVNLIRAELPPQHSEIGKALILLGSCASAAKEYAVAESDYSEALFIASTDDDAVATMQRQALEGLRIVALGTGRLRDALSFVRREAGLADRMLPASDPNRESAQASFRAVQLTFDAMFHVIRRTEALAPLPPRLSDERRDRAASVDWIMGSLHSGNWTEDAREFEDAVVLALDRWFMKLGELDSEPFSRATKLSRIRCLLVPHWGREAWLVEGQVELDSEPALFSGLWLDNEFYPADGRSDLLHALNAQHPPDLSSPEKRMDYLIFFCSWIRSERGRFIIFEQPEAIGPDLWKLVHGGTLSQPLPQDGHESWEYVVALSFAGDLFRATLRLSQDGKVEMTSDTEVAPNIGTVEEVWNGPFRRPARQSPDLLP